MKRRGAERVVGIGVAPADIGPDVERAVAPLGQGGVLVAGEVGEGAAGDLDELDVGAAAGVAGDPYRARLVALHVERRGGRVITVPREEAVGQLVTVPAVDRGHHRRGEGQLPPEHGQALHVRIRLQEARADVVQPALQRGSAAGQRRGMDEVLHRVGRDDQRVVAVDMGGREVTFERDRDGEVAQSMRRRVAANTDETDRGLAVAVGSEFDHRAVSLPWRSIAMSTTASRARWSSLVRSASMAAVISGSSASRERPATKTQ